MSALLAAVLCQTEMAEFERLLAEFQLAMEAEYATTTTETSARSTEAVNRLDTPSSRDALWRALSDPELSPQTRLAVIDAISRIGDLRNLQQLLTALMQMRASGTPVATKVERAENRIRTLRKEAPASLEERKKPAAPAPPPERKINLTNLILGGAALTLAGLLWLLRRGRA